MSSLYIHIPFCDKKCFYCSFVVAVGQQDKIENYLNSIKIEARQYKGEEISTVYIGGGTPSILNLSQIKYLFKIIHDAFKVLPSAEITFEANPESIDFDKMILLKRLGVNRISLGAQTFQEKYLQYLGRNHNAESVLKARKIIGDAGIHSINLDMMFSFPNQSKNELENDLVEFTKLNSEHLSLYTLTIEENSRFYVKKMKLDHPDVQADHYEFVRNYLTNQGFHQYEVSNFAKHGFRSRHNLNYWQGNEYIGLGVGAHSFFSGSRYWNVSRMMIYIEMINKSGRAEQSSEDVNSCQQLENSVLFGLRMNDGVDLERQQERYNARLTAGQYELIQDFVTQKLLIKENNIIKASDRGRLVLDEICSRLIT